jgi:NADPH2:quinone reductase
MRALVVPSTAATPKVADLPTPTPGEGELLVRISAASLNGFDLSVAAGHVEQMMEHRYPVVLGKDFAGVVEAVGAGVESFAVGDRVFGVVTKEYLGDGSFGEYVTVPVAIGVAKLPDGVSFAEGAALGLAGTAARMSVDAAAPKSGQVVLVIGATGGVGNHAVQLTARAGATVIATAHGEEEQQLVRRFGAAHVVDHTTSLVDGVRAVAPDGVDTVLHFAGDPAESATLVRPGGTFVSTRVGSPDQVPAENVAVVGIYAQPTPDVLDAIAADQANGAVTVHVQRTYRLDEAAQAMADFAAGTLGKLVVEVS